MTQKHATLYVTVGLALMLGFAAYLIGKAFTDNLLELALYAVVAAISVIGVKVKADDWAKIKQAALQTAEQKNNNHPVTIGNGCSSESKMAPEL